MSGTINNSCFWVYKNILQMRNKVQNLHVMTSMRQNNKFDMKMVYLALKEDHQEVDWKKLLLANLARPIA